MTTPQIGHNSLVAELAEKMSEIRDRMKIAEKTGSARARWEVLCSDMEPTDKFIALVMSCFADDGEEISPTIETLEVLTGYKKRRILGAIQAAKKADVIEQKAPAHRGASAVYAFKIPDRTLSELALRVHGDAPIKPIGCTVMHPLPERVSPDAPITAERVHGDDKGCTVMHPLPERVSPDAPITAERVHGDDKGCTVMHPMHGDAPITAERVHGDAPFSPIYKDIKKKKEQEDAGAQAAQTDPVYVNGVGIIGPGFTLDYKSIEVCAQLCGMSLEKGKLVAELAARRWAASNFVPGSANAVLRKVMATERINIQVDQAKLEKELAKLKAEQATPIARMSPPTAAKPAWQNTRSAPGVDACRNAMRDVAARMAREAAT